MCAFQRLVFHGPHSFRCTEDTVIGQDDPQWASWSDDALLDLPMCDLHVGLKGGFLEQPIAELTQELESTGLLVSSSLLALQ